jgi:hypothetical protein
VDFQRSEVASFCSRYNLGMIDANMFKFSLSAQFVTIL